MSKLLEIFGKGISINTADLIWHWLNTLVSANGPDSTPSTGELQTVIELLGQMELEKARETLRFYQFENPDCIFGKMADVAGLFHEHKIPQALEILTDAYRSKPNNTMVLYAIGYCHERLGDHEQAIAFYQDCLKFKNHLQLPRQRLAAIFFRQGRLDRVIDEYQRLVAEYPNDVSSQVILGYLLAADHQWHLAADSFNMAILSHPDNFSDPSEPEEAELVEQGNYDYALERVQWLMDQMGEMPDLHVRMADIYKAAGDGSTAQVHLERALQLQPDYLEAAIKLGTHHLRQGRYVTAAAQFNRAVEINDEIVDAYAGLAAAQELSGDSDAAYGTLSLASAIQQNTVLLFAETASLNLLAILRHTGEDCDYKSGSGQLLKRVLDAHRKKILHKPDSADGQYKYGILMLAAGDREQARVAFEKALQINPTHYRARTKLTMCLFEMDQKRRAINNLTTLDSLERESLNLHYQTALLYCDRRKFADALGTLNNHVQERIAGAEVVVNIEVVLENLGLMDRAVASWERLTELATGTLSQS
ncbi:tetratricopeptide repeat protein [Anaerohalosphaera lusitana]|uniref:Tetratricopeptide repeat protein n=1 Tax=Anaerohalosphaera lusitana TaxID=1936003 RepID=A0A1U9NML3_9BACT|nr:tetratricopeptide repeat protein [Anaerohalosphaera lusitana]AQT69149.1 tetratricopeptide repeat protein [Anaerohalosphaera lusitana]